MEKFPKQLLSEGSGNAKLSKNSKFDYESYILYLAPHTQNSLGVNLCPHASPDCISGCLFTAGRGAFSNVFLSRTLKTEYYLKHRVQFLNHIVQELHKIAKRKRKTSIRLNGTSDIDFIKLFKSYGHDLLTMFPDLKFYDYTKSLHRWLKYKDTSYHLTFSRSETNEDECMQVLAMGGSVAVVFDKLPTTWRGYRVIDGDVSDLRFLDDKNVIVGLKAKGKAKRDTGGFVVRVDNDNETTWKQCVEWVIED